VSTLKPILIVEDNPNDLELTLNALEKSRLANEVIVARDGAESANYLFRDFADRPEGNPAAVLLDLKLPKIDGLELLRMVRENEATGRTPTLLLTSSKEDKDVVNGYKLGVNAYVVKSGAFNEFVQAIQGLGVFWAELNEPPPGSTRVTRND
jgi:DNA-binding response OmpR family regulator